MAAPVVPTMLAINVPKARTLALSAGVPRRSPVMRMPPATTYSANSRMMKLMYSASIACTNAASAVFASVATAIGISVSNVQAAAILP